MKPVPFEQANVTIGRYAEIGVGVEVIRLVENAPLVIGDCARIGDGVRFVVGARGASFGDYLTLHERVLVMARGPIVAGHNLWCARNVVLDGTGELNIGHGVRIGASSQVWSHAEAGEEIEGCLFNSSKPTVLGEGAWLMGCVHVNPGVHVGVRSVIANGSVVTRSTEAWTLYAGTPARKLPALVWSRPPLAAKLVSMFAWAGEYAHERGLRTNACEHVPGQALTLSDDDDQVCIAGVNCPTPLESDASVTWIDVSRRTYTKRLTPIERGFIGWLEGRRARFIPV